MTVLLTEPLRGNVCLCAAKGSPKGVCLFIRVDKYEVSRFRHSEVLSESF